MDSSLSADQKATLEGKVLEEVEEASATLKTLHATLWKAFEGTAGIQDSFCKVVAASKTVDTIRNKLTVLRDAEESPEITLVKDEDVDCKLDPEIEDRLHAECLPTPRRLASRGSFSLTHPTSQHNLQKGRRQWTVQQALPPST
ncbi:hypothetical protein SCLCIDRAFT_229096 [Scleroderma citrinum Foug A]|uniref:Uncharacterized protein n=1 Tax=Scleroderma citrinum Foug A TaxID=1036808 RepID=A0A0C3AQG4_9AGAM|nr:hypothetical protein SCLCIDRAFT_229096 [Scleroderma citrinum Foug A]